LCNFRRAGGATCQLGDCPGRQRNLAAAAARTATERLTAWNRHLTRLDHRDRTAWAEAARQTAGALGAAAHHRDHAGTLNRAARIMARSAQQTRPGRTPANPSHDGAMAAALVLRTGRGTGLPAELLSTARLIEAHHRAVGARTEAARIHTAVITPLTALGLTAGIHQALARAAERAVEPEPHYRAREQTEAATGTWDRNADLGAAREVVVARYRRSPTYAPVPVRPVAVGGTLSGICF